ncbi:LacI family DNA-binding transcriptional regulator [Robbsia sp. KACC 23696]|uniref:LacI family DNA-binding transcriptional regulator n=1 Tax=Robbsia sp. KACC 23696 TaxID=3149231 RepID=UPI00325B616D
MPQRLKASLAPAVKRVDAPRAAKPATPQASQFPSTAHDVARLAGVSQSAVSRCFTPGASVSDAMRQRVQQAADTLGYRPNLIARSLIKRESTIIGVVLPDLDNPFYASVVGRLSSMLTETGRRILLFRSPATDSSDPVLEDVLRYRVDGLILVSSPLSSTFADECVRIGLPVVQLNRTSMRARVSSVVGDNVRGAARIAEHLLRHGHRRLAYVAGQDGSSTSQERENGFTAALRQAGLTLALRETGHYTQDGARAATQRLLSLPEPPDAIFFANDYMALAGLSVARHAFGADIGRSLSIVGFDDIPMAAWPEFSLATFRQPIDAMCARTVEIIQAQLGDIGVAPQRLVLPGELVVRGSVRGGVVDPLA